MYTGVKLCGNVIDGGPWCRLRWVPLLSTIINFENEFATGIGDSHKN